MHKKIVSISLAIFMTFQLCGGSLAFTAEDHSDILIEDSSDFILETGTDSFEEYTGSILTMPDGTVYYRNEDEQRIVKEETLNHQEYEAATYNSASAFDISTYNLPEVDLNGSSDFGDLSQYATTYGYDFLGTMENGAARQQFYDEIDVLSVEFHTNYTLDSVGGVVGTIDFEQYGLTFDDALSVWITYKYDHPLYYWISNIVSYTESSLFLMTDELYSIGSTREIYNIYLIEKINEWKSIVGGETSAYRKALAYHDEIIKTIDYAYESDGFTPEDDIWAHNILGVFEIGSGVCESYAKTFQLMLNIVGVENIVVTGDSNGEEHMWNLVKLDDGQWYWCDLTWDDTPGWEWGISYNYFCVNDAQNVAWKDGGWDSEFTTFLSTHNINLPTDSVEMFLYELPSRSLNEYSGCNGELLLRDCFTVNGFSYAVVGYNTVQVTYMDIAGEAYIPETVEYNDVKYTTISIGCITSDGLLKYGNIGGNNVTAVHIPKSVSFIWERVFAVAVSIEKFVVDSENPFFTSDDGVLFTKSLYTLICYPLGSDRREYYVPDETFEIAYGAFGDYYSPANLDNDLEVLTFGKNIEFVGRINQGDGYWDEPPTGFNLRIYDTSVFLNIYNMLNGAKIISVNEENQTFSSTDDYIVKTERNVCTEVACYAEYKTLCFVLSKNISELIIPDDIQDIEHFCFIDCVDLRELYIPDSVEYIRSNAFVGCFELKNVRLPKELKTISNNCFQSCQKLEYIEIPDKVETIESTAFMNCTSLKFVILPEGLVNIAQSAFQGCYNLKYIDIPSSVSEIQPYVFSSCIGLECIVLPEDLTKIGNNAFSYCSNLNKVVFMGKTPSEIEFNAFIGTADDFTVYYMKDSEGWISPIWEGPDGVLYSTEVFNYEEFSSVPYFCEHTNLTEYKAEPSTCYTLGHNKYYICDSCKTIFSEDRVTMTTINAETYTEYGHVGGIKSCELQAQCESCGAFYGDLANHEYDMSVWQTGDSSGHWHGCVNCNEHDEPEAHTPGPEATEEAPQICTVCGYVIKDIRFTLGDVNDDGLINLDDVVKLLRHVSKADIITDSKLLAAGEIVEDGILNLDDVVRLLRYVSKAIPSLR